jgi:hypothetical protein
MKAESYLPENDYLIFATENPEAFAPSIKVWRVFAPPSQYSYDGEP